MNKDNSVMPKTFILLVLCVAVQFLLKERFSFSFYIIEIFIQFSMVAAMLWLGIYSGLLIALLTPITAYLIIGSQVTYELAVINPVLMASYAVLCLSIWFFKEKTSFSFRLIPGALIGILLKTGILWFGVCKYIIPHFGGSLTVATEDLPLFLRSTKQYYSLYHLLISFGVCLLSIAIYMILDKKKTSDK